MKLLLILNENPQGSHDDVHNSLASLKRDNILESYIVYPYLARLTDGLRNQEVVNEIIKIAKDFQPNIILWSHTTKLFISEKKFIILKRLPSEPSMGYWDGDIYHKFYKPLPNTIIKLARMCDVSFWPGYSKMTLYLKKRGCGDIRYVPLSTDKERFSTLRKNEIKYDVVMVGNNIRSSIPFKTFPGSIERRKIAEFFYKNLGPRFAVFGNGWSKKYSKGPVPFKKQNCVYQSSRISLGLNSLHAQYYFSNRLPISLSSGVIMVHNYENGFEEIFNKIDYPFFFKDFDQAWKIVKSLLAKSQEELDELGRRYRNFALVNLTMIQNLKYMIEVLHSYNINKDNRKMLKRIPNPWIKNPQI